MAQLTITRKHQGQDFTIFAVTDSETGVSEEVALPSEAGNPSSDFTDGAAFCAVPEGVDISSRYHYLAN